PRVAKIVNVTLPPHHGLPGMARSSAARAAVENLTRVLSIEWSRFGIRLVALAAGQFATQALLAQVPKPGLAGCRLRARPRAHHRRGTRHRVRRRAAGRAPCRGREAARGGPAAEAMTD